jgi:SAM-dependent methyltransferase
MVADYELIAEPFTQPYAEQAVVLAGGVRAGTRVLDVAAGTGALTLLAARAGAHVLGTDFAPGMVARLAERIAAAGFDDVRCSARVMDGRALDLPDDSFDMAFSMFGVMLFDDPLRGLAEMVRVVRPGGRVVLAVWAVAGGAGPAPLLVDAVESLWPGRDLPPLPPGLQRWSDRALLAQDVRAAGAHDVAVRTVEGTWEAPSATWVVDNLDRLFFQSPLWRSFTPDEQGRVRDTMRARVGAAYPDAVAVVSHAHVAVGTVGL